MSTLLNGAIAAALLLLSQGVGHAQATRTWVSGVGDDANPCSRTAPCKTFAGAISKTAAGGEISVLDPGGFGAVTITKSMSIVSEGSEGSILASLVNGVIVNAGVNDVVNLHGLFLEGAGNGIKGIRILSAKSVHIRKCLIRGFQNASGGAIFVESTPAVNVFVSECTLSKNQQGVQVNVPSAGQNRVFLDRVVIDNNTTFGVRASGARARVFMSNSIVTENGTGLEAAGGLITSYGNNVILGNGTDGAPTGTLPLQ